MWPLRELAIGNHSLKHNMTKANPFIAKARKYFPIMQLVHFEIFFSVRQTFRDKLFESSSVSSSSHRYLKSLVYTLNHNAKLNQRLLIGPEKSIWHLMTDLHQTLCRSRALLTIIDVRKNRLAENLTDYYSKDYCHLSIYKAS